ncbi:hypothetical protein [Candidatus Poriferisodalis sp.]|uniref:hypothetical protein n=1 Tax=Candidatus Poriferisodalis sp. TaxID=3101277 RepID=UPI003B519E91
MNAANVEQPANEVDIRAEALRSDEVACQAAYEWSRQLVDDALRTLEAQRTRAVALLSMTILIAGVAASVAPAGYADNSIGGVGIIGWVLFALGTTSVAVCAGIVAWPVTTDAALRPTLIIENLVEPQHETRSRVWAYKALVRDLFGAYERDLKRSAAARNTAYKMLLGAVYAVLAAAALVWADAIF